jgi:DNA-binding PadR family transcriptional regulator
MSSIDLVLLGFAKKGPLNAYELVKIIERTQMTKWLKIGLPTIYQNLRKLAERGFLAADSVSSGNMPDKTLYSITLSGETHWRKLMNQYSSEPGNIYFDFNAFVVNMGLLDPDSRLGMLENLKRHFLAQREGLESSIAESGTVPMEGRAIMAQYRMIFETIIEWIESYIKEIGDAK